MVRAAATVVHISVKKLDVPFVDAQAAPPANCKTFQGRFLFTAVRGTCAPQLNKLKEFQYFHDKILSNKQSLEL